jgi:hypothetical protein
VDAHRDVGHAVVGFGGAAIGEARAEGDLVARLDEPWAIEVYAVALTSSVCTLYVVYVRSTDQSIFVRIRIHEVY